MEQGVTGIERCEVCVVGAGLAGLNALATASQYLGRGERVILADSRDRVGGMWVDAYDYVRLHQPHRLFTAGDIRWELPAPREHLATKGEVLDHFARCLEVISQRCEVDTRFGWRYVGHEELADVVRVTFVARDGSTRLVEAKRLVKAFGFQISPKQPLAVSTSRVRSVSPDHWDPLGDDVRRDDAPVWIVGGGKTGMDTAHAVISAYPGREVNLVAGREMAFVDRDAMLPTGFRRWTCPQFNVVFGEMARRFDGTNERQVLSWVRRNHCLTVTSGGEPGFMLGVLSRAERDTIVRGLHTVVTDRLVDAVDSATGPRLAFRWHDPVSVPEGSWLVNCTGYLAREDLPYEPYVSPGGRVLSINQTSSTLPFSSHMGHFMPHLLLRGLLGSLPLYELDVPALQRRSQAALCGALASLTQLNMGLMAEALPARAFLSWGSDYERWYPLPRRALVAARFALTAKRERPHHQRSLDRVAERFGVRCGPLPHVAGPVADRRPGSLQDA